MRRQGVRSRVFNGQKHPDILEMQGSFDDLTERRWAIRPVNIQHSDVSLLKHVIVGIVLANPSFWASQRILHPFLPTHGIDSRGLRKGA